MIKLICTSDTHHHVDIHRKHDNGEPWFPNDPDMISVHAGDLTRNGYPDEWQNTIKWLAELPYKQKILIFGNHDFHPFNYPGPALQDLRRIGVTVLGYPGNDNYQSMKLSNGMSILGLPYVTDLPRWAFNINEKRLWEHLQIMGKHDIIVSHMPPYQILDSEYAFGSTAYRKYLTKYNPKVWISGHVHESYGYKEVEGCKFYNVAMCNRDYVHQNPPVIIEI